jgi:hypothetical protein
MKYDEILSSPPFSVSVTLRTYGTDPLPHEISPPLIPRRPEQVDIWEDPVEMPS